jgi:hypothetical protein
MTHIIMALDEIEMILGANTMSTANATDTTMGKSANNMSKGFRM